MIMNRPAIVIGSGGHARVLISALNALQREVFGILHPDATLVGQSIAGIRILGNDDKVREYASDTIELVNGIGSVSSTAKRKDIFIKFKKKGYSFAQIIHPSATIMPDVQSGEGVQIMAGAIVQTGCVIGNNAIVNTGAILDHDCMIGAHVHVASGAVLSGGVRIGEMAHIGTAAIIIQGIKIGYEAIIGAGAVVIRDVPPGKKAIGNPARIKE